MTVQAGKHIIKVDLNLDKLIANCDFTCKVQKRNHFRKTALDNSILLLIGPTQIIDGYENQLRSNPATAQQE